MNEPCPLPPTPKVTISHVEDAHRLIDFAISEALQKRKPSYIEAGSTAPVPCVTLCTFGRKHA
jgi:hypothetical protein